MKKSYSPFDYSLIISRKNRYLTVESPDFGGRVACGTIELGEVSPDAIGRAVLIAWSQICQKLNAFEASRCVQPKPKKLTLLTRDLVTTREAARILGISAAILRKLARTGAYGAERTPGGHFRYPLEALVSPAQSPLKEAV